MYYINVFRDKNGIEHYSCEEFSQHKYAIRDFIDTLHDAHLNTHDSNWEYVSTLTSNPVVSLHISGHLAQLESVAEFAFNSKELLGLLQDQ